MAIEKQRKTFLSYSRVNKEFAARLAKELKSEGFHVWLDILDIPAGARWDVEVEKALEECDIFMIIMTPAAIASENVRDEIGYAIDNNKRFLPVLLENCNVPLRLRRFQYVDFTNKNFDDGVESAKELLRGLIAQPTIPKGVVVADLQEEADRLAKQKAETEKAEVDRLAKQKAEAEKAAKAEADRKAKDEADRLAKQKAETEKTAKAEADRKAKEEADRLAKQKAEAEKAAKVEADRKAKEEADRLARQKAEGEKAAKAEADRKAKEEADRLAKQKAEAEKAAKAEADRKSKEEADRLARQRGATTESMSGKPTPQKKTISKGLIFGVIGVVLIAVCGIGYGIMSSLSPAATEAPIVFEPTSPEEQQPVPTPKPVQATATTENVEQASQPTATEPVVPTQTEKPAFFLMRFAQDTPLDDFEFFEIGSGDESKLTITPTNSGLEFNLNDDDLYAYLIYTPYIYEDVVVRMRAENIGTLNRNNVSLVCRRTGDAWYEFSVESGGLWTLWAHDSSGYSSIGSGGTTALNLGQAVNEYEMRCVGNDISMVINGQAVKTITLDANSRFLFPNGEVGLNISSLDIFPIEILVTEFEVSQP